MQRCNPRAAHRSFLRSLVLSPSNQCSRPSPACTSRRYGVTFFVDTSPTGRCRRLSPYLVRQQKRLITHITSISNTRSQSQSRSRSSSSSSSTRWLTRATRDPYTKLARLQNLKSRAAFKLLDLHARHRLFRPGQTVVDLGFAPGSWSQVAVDLTRPHGKVLGVDVIPAQPPRGVSTIQGDFLHEDTQHKVRGFFLDDHTKNEGVALDRSAIENETGAEGYVERAKELSDPKETRENDDAKVVDIILSDMSAPWELVTGFHNKSFSNPYHRMMNTSGNAFRDHAGSMDLCRAALHFSYDTLKIGGHFVCKFYQGAEDKSLEKSLKGMFAKVHREKPESSRKDSKESYFVGLRRLARCDRDAVFGVG